MDLLLGSDGDIVFINGECPVTNENRDVIAQRLTIRLRSFLGEWFLNTKYGPPWFQKILGRKTSKVSVDRILQSEILKEPGVVELVEFNSTLNRNRSYTMNFRVRTTSGALSDLIAVDNIGI